MALSDEASKAARTRPRNASALPAPSSLISLMLNVSPQSAIFILTSAFQHSWPKWHRHLLPRWRRTTAKQRREKNADKDRPVQPPVGFDGVKTGMSAGLVTE